MILVRQEAAHDEYIQKTPQLTVPLCSRTVSVYWKDKCCQTLKITGVYLHRTVKPASDQMGASTGKASGARYRDVRPGRLLVGYLNDPGLERPYSLRGGKLGIR